VQYNGLCLFCQQANLLCRSRVGNSAIWFEKQYNGTKCDNAIFIAVLFCALRRIQSLSAACRNLNGSTDDRTVATAILKTLPEY